MRNFTFLAAVITIIFFAFSFKPIHYKIKNASENVLVSKNSVLSVTVDSVSVNQFFKKYSKLKKYKKDVLDIYKKRDFKSIWYDQKNITEFGNLLYQKVNFLKDQGIENTMPYKDDIDEAFNESADEKPSQLETELLLTNMYVFYASNVYSGVDPATLKKIGWFLPAKTISYARILDSLIVDSNRLNEDDNLLFSQYYKLQAALKKYRKIETDNLWNKITIDEANYKDLKPFDISNTIKEIRQRLFVVGDISQDSKSDVYDEELMAGVLNYKKRYGLKLNYTLTKEHIDQLNEPIANRIKTIMINMERCRWIPAKLAKADEYVMVNIPSFRLFYVKNGKYDLVSDIFVGTRMTETVIFSGDMDRIVFSPYWNVPASIIKNELRSQIARDKNYLAENNMEWNGGRVRQKPGPKNSLGLVKFMFPNPNDIYLHDTPAKSLFEFEKRTFSHGCINVKEAKKLAIEILKDDPDWPVDKIDKAMSGEKETTCMLKKKIPIYIGYFTAWVNDEGEISFFPDVYGRDESLDKLLYSDSVTMK
ncbi:L,D-transpeptidase family protein [Flavobacterium sp. MC2016-06]|jgi:murein L,D-transpeptidase YcbB/YkuD|uniref:L,D-transpeptidase family protein n=1 Tax=Flavobacterium sp. MC2016-06 TaxID=2676308 RepID=UPI0012BADD33|nr:L,D-transpeptidase family protein [Flavobacterium sp. MC2016-06]MBU3862237.1 L,D-transpeptidase family protein [Flavobacterium sp. MC2016-06]